MTFWKISADDMIGSGKRASTAELDQASFFHAFCVFGNTLRGSGIDDGVEPMGNMNGIPLEESLMEIENAIFMAQNAPFDMQQRMFDRMMGPFGPGPMM